MYAVPVHALTHLQIFVKYQLQSFVLDFLLFLPNRLQQSGDMGVQYVQGRLSANIYSKLLLFHLLIERMILHIFQMVSSISTYLFLMFQYELYS